MGTRSYGRLLPLASWLVLASALGCENGGCRSVEPKTGPKSITLDGSSTVFLIADVVVSEFRRRDPKIDVSVGISGTGGGLARLCDAKIDIATASRLITKEESASCAQHGVAFIELPTAFDGIVVAVNPANTWAEHISVQQLRKIWEPSAQGRVNKWSDVQPGWPDRPLHLYGAGRKSGTFDYFSEAIVGEARVSRTDYSASEDDNVIVQAVANDELALGFFGLAYYRDNQASLKPLAIGEFGSETSPPVLPSQESIRLGRYQPLSRPIFLYVSSQAAVRPEVRRFVQLWFEIAENAVDAVGYVPFPKESYAQILGRFQRNRTGSSLAGRVSLVGLPLRDLLQE